MSPANQAGMRRAVAAAGAAIAVLALTAQPTFAVGGGYAEAARFIELAGERDELRMDARVLDPAPASTVSMVAGFGLEEPKARITLVLRSSDTSRESRRVEVRGRGRFKGVTGDGCELEPETDGTGTLTCILEDYNWTTDRYYSMRVRRGGQNSNGWLWTVRLHDMLNPTEPMTITSFRLPHGKLSTNGSVVVANATIADCKAVNPVHAHAKRPSGDGSTVTWSEPFVYRESCAGATVKAPVDRNGDVNLIIAQ